MTTTYTPAATTAAERMNTPTECGHCNRSGLKTTVKMVAGGAIVWMGTGCASKAMGMPAAEFNALRKVVEAEARKVEEIERQAKAQVEFAAWKAFLDGAAGPGDTVDQLTKLGGYAAATALYRAA